MRQAVIYPGEDGYWVAEVPSLPGCISQGKTKEEAIINITALDEDGVTTA
jgi:predicted RNase H-like HicB family nuclease